MRRLYEVRLTPNERGGYDAYVPSIDMVTAGDTIEDAVSMAYDLVYTAVPSFLADGDTITEDAFEQEDGVIMAAVMVDCDENTPEVGWMTVREAADMLGVGPSRIHALVKSGMLDSRKEGTCRLVSTESVRRRVNAVPAAGRPRAEREAEMAMA